MAKFFYFIFGFFIYFTTFTLSQDCQFSKSSPIENITIPKCSYDQSAIVTDGCVSYAYLDSLNSVLRPYINSITQNTDFFSHYRLNLFKNKCLFWSDVHGVCGNIACAVNPVENDSDIPLVWKSQELGKLQQSSNPKPPSSTNFPPPSSSPNHHPNLCVADTSECDDRDYCIPDDELLSSKGDYVSLVDNPEKFTGYTGIGAQMVWAAIYRENCFTKARELSSNLNYRDGHSKRKNEAESLKQIFRDSAKLPLVQQAIARGTPAISLDSVEFDDECVEKRVFYRVVSGMHASISTHICAEYLNRQTGVWGPNLDCFIKKVYNYPDRVSNIYFNYALLLRAVGKLRNHAESYEFCSPDSEQDRLTKRLLISLADAIPPGLEVFNETRLFQFPADLVLKQEFRSRFRNISRIMDCVGCDKCRLWGKLQTAGYGTAFKVLFEFNESNTFHNPPLRRTELVALINTLGRVSNSLHYIKIFSQMISAHQLNPSQSTPSPLNPHENSPGSSNSTLLNPPPPPPPPPPLPSFKTTLKDSFLSEFSLVFRTFKYVIKSWLNLPAKLWSLILNEIGRLWDYWLGLPVSPRVWTFRLPRRDEL